MGVEERLAHVEGLVAGHAQLLGDLRTAVTSLEGRLDRRFDQVETRFTQVEGRLATIEQKVDARIDALGRKLEATAAAGDQRFETRFSDAERKFETRFVALDQKLDGIQREMTTHFRWTMGALVTIVAVFLGAVLTR